MIVVVIVVLVWLGLVLGSFVNALVWRIHVRAELADNQDKPKKRNRAKTPAASKKDVRRYSIMTGRSMCPHCEHELAARDLVPVFSWLLLRGKCRYCHKPIAWQYPLVELLTAVLFLVSYVFWPEALHGYGLLGFGFWLVFLTGFMALAVYDIKWFLLPDRIVWPLAGLALMQVLLHVFVFGGGLPVVEAAAWGVAVGSGIFFVIYRIALETNREWIGYGDVKLGLVLGLLVGGPLGAALLLFVSSLLGTLTALPLLISGKAKRTSLIPYGPFLMAATVILVLAGPPLQKAVERLLMP